MNYKKTLGAFFLFGAIIISNVPVNALSNISDWAKQSVNEAEEMGIIPQSLEDAQAQKAISRAEFCEIVVKLYEKLISKTAPTDVISPFTDTDNKYIAAASKLGLVNGKGNGIFDPYSTITRQEFCVMMGNLMRVIGDKSENAQTNVISSFKDAGDVSSWAKQDVETIIGKGVMTGVKEENGDILLKPLGQATREQALVMAVRFMDSYDVLDDGKQDNTDNSDNSTPPENNTDNSENTNQTDDSQSNPTEDEQQNNTQIQDLPILPEEAKSLTKDQRLLRLFGKTEIGFTSQAEAEANMTQIKVPVWRLNSDNTKRAGEITLTVNSNLALVYKAIFTDIFNGSEQFPIKDAGSYAWRSNTRSEHRWGTAIDLNWNENMECYIDEFGNVTQITTGSYWLPEQDPYSIKPDGDVVRAFAKYGFAWGGDAWKSKRDYMHFSYFGT